MPTPTVRRLQLGNELRHLRDRAGLELTDAAEVIERSWSVVSKLERGLTGIRQKPLRELVTYYRDHIGTRDDGTPRDGGEPIDPEQFCELNKGSENRGRWRGYRATHPQHFRIAVDLEADAQVINIYQTEVVHGLFQTEEYMRAMFENVRYGDEETEQRIKARLERQHVLDKEDAPEITAVLSESAIRRVYGDSAIMHRQLRHLAELAELPMVHLHILPFTAIPAMASSFPFVHFRVPSASTNAPPLEFVYIEQYNNGDYLDGVNDVATYSGLWNGLLGAALDPVESKDFLLRVATEFA
ncbi:helix-turn-helix domain-containing protein [Actinopolyspora halophila]|uniref:helix-turn-helix domain-containing protein n=1 Tax=Actinopolyspora TaxID=1849 RepID=UPI0003A5D440|nr:helix-turn-helix transcriptional regulator [Actinopolyspora halophila]